MNDVTTLLDPRKHPLANTAQGVIFRLQPGTKVQYTRRGSEDEYMGTIQLVIEDAIIVTRPSSDNPVILRIDAIDTLELIHE